MPNSTERNAAEDKVWTRAQEFRSEKSPQKTANILIIDDDIDSALLIESVFAHLGCPTTCSLNPIEAKRKICSHKADIIILDWVLDHHTDGGGVMEQCVRLFEKFQAQGTRPKIITYSSLDASEIDLRDSPYFEHLDHWKKPIPRRDLLAKALQLLERLGR